MNDFTKEELKFFLMAIKPFYFLWRESSLKLESKIQSLIDNHCDHDDGGGEVEIFSDTCKKCDPYVLREQKWMECSE